MKTHDRVGSIFWLMMGIYIAIHSYRLGLGHLHQPGPGFIFFLTALLLIILSAIELARTFIGKPKTYKEKKEVPIWIGLRWQKILLVLGGASAYVYFFNVAGFFLSTFLLMVFLFKGVEPTKWWIAIVSSLITTVLSYGIFKVWLEVPFPAGFLRF
jgi:putative tricarboxylic transport membrane protein